MMQTNANHPLLSYFVLNLLLHNMRWLKCHLWPYSPLLLPQLLLATAIPCWHASLYR